MLVGCQQDQNQQRTPSFDASISVDELMHLVIEPSADVLWDSAGFIMTLEGEESLTPTDDEGWLAVESAAAVIVESGNLLKLSDRIPEDGNLWIDFSDQMTLVGHQALQATTDRDGDALFQAGADLYQSCLNCHDVYWTMANDGATPESTY